LADDDAVENAARAHGRTDRFLGQLLEIEAGHLAGDDDFTFADGHNEAAKLGERAGRENVRGLRSHDGRTTHRINSFSMVTPAEYEASTSIHESAAAGMTHHAKRRKIGKRGSESFLLPSESWRVLSQHLMLRAEKFSCNGYSTFFSKKGSQGVFEDNCF
jgi:hypothetical protein